MFLFIYLLSFLLSPPAFASGGAFVGNGGEGYLVGGRVILRDLIDYPWMPSLFRAAPDPQFVALWKSAHGLWGLGAKYRSNSSYLLQALSTIEDSYPGLGYQLLGAMSNYVWKPVPGRSLRHQAEPGAKYPVVILAIRAGDTIYLNEEQFGLLEEEQQAALLLHEAAYSLVRPACDASGKCEQSSDLIKRVTAHLMSLPLDRNWAFLRGLAFAKAEGLCKPDELSVQLRSDPAGPTLFRARFASRPWAPADFEREARAFCERFASGAAPTFLRNNLRFHSFNYRFEKYPASFGEQLALRVGTQSRGLGSLWERVEGPGSCLSFLKAYVSDAQKSRAADFVGNLAQRVCPARSLPQ